MKSGNDDGPMRVLLIEDTPGDRRLVRDQLAETGAFEIQTAITAAEGLARAHEGGYDAIVLDLGLPDSTGLETLSLFRAVSATCPIVVLGDLDDEASGAAAVRLGAQDYVTKRRLTPPLVAKSIRFAVERARQAEVMRRDTRMWMTVFDAVEEGMLLLDVDRRILKCNESFVRMAGRPRDEIIGRKCHEVVHDSDRPIVGCPFDLARSLRRRNKASFAAGGRAFEVAVDPVVNDDGGFAGAAHVITDVTERRRSEEILRMRLRLGEFGADHTTDELLVMTLDEICALTGSRIGFYHFVDADEKSLTLKAWSTRTTKEFCTAQAGAAHYPISEAGVWVDCVHARKPVIHNDYASLPHKKGLPDGHAPVVRELVVPVVRAGRIRAVLGVGNKPADYDDADAALVSFLADVAWVIAERKLAEEALLVSEARHRALYESSRDAVMTLEPPSWRFTAGNPATIALFGAGTESVFVTKGPWDVSPERQPDGRASAEKAQEMIEKAMDEGSNFFEWTHRRLDGTAFPATVLLTRVQLGERRFLQATVRDITGRKKLEEQLLQSQKMEGIGKLAGGIAHDFNNILSVIISNAGFLFEALPDGDPRRKDAEEIAKAGRRAADLTRQLLAFSRKQMLQPCVLDINETIVGMNKMLTRVIGEDVSLATSLTPEIWTVRADPGQMEQVLMNLAVNARDAMPRGGKLAIETKNVELDDEFTRTHEGITPGPYVVLSMADTGCGMEAETLSRIYEPFFTTKGVGKGTGLGLSTVYGIIRQSGGNIFAESEPGRGTTFRIYLPRHGKTAEPGGLATAHAVPAGTETILLVEDEEPVRQVARQILKRKGYRVLETTDTDEAAAICKTHAGKIDLLLTDVVMPKLGGRELADKLLALRPDMKVLYMSGYTDDAIVRHGVLDEGTAFIQKPFTPETLPRKVREVLDARPLIL